MATVFTSGLLVRIICSREKIFYYRKHCKENVNFDSNSKNKLRCRQNDNGKEEEDTARKMLQTETCQKTWKWYRVFAGSSDRVYKVIYYSLQVLRPTVRVAY